jgi:hypothetical protein
MAFPPKPQTDDEVRATLLRLMGVPRRPGLYILGSFARYVTVYAQQVRALNLVDTLAKSGRISARSRIAIIGGGVGGLTVATAAARLGIAKVHVFEKLEDPMRLQWSSLQRYLHPHIYDWPLSDNTSSTSADLPFMSWDAKVAGDVMRDLKRQWDALAPDDSDRLRITCGCSPVRIEAADGEWAVVCGSARSTFDIVVLAVGFGVEPVALGPGYWTDTPLDAVEIETDNQSWLVSGAGDGALTDLMRLCIRNFRHAEVIDAIDSDMGARVGQRLSNAEKEGLSGNEMARLYLEAVEDIAPALDERLPRRSGLSQIWLNVSADDELFIPRSSILNRLITAYLLKRGRFELIVGRFKSHHAATRTVRFQSGEELMNVDHVIVRHGPVPALMQDFPEIWNACGSLRREWAGASQLTDWTREPLFTTTDFAPTAGTSNLPIDLEDGVHCLVIGCHQKSGGPPLRMYVRNATQRLAQRSGSDRFGPIHTGPVFISTTDVFANSAAYERVVRALCKVDIAVFDITDLESATMLLLGIRSAVRRGVTVTVTRDIDEEEGLPFNLTALNPIRLNRFGDDVEAIADAMEHGLVGLAAWPHAYLDLPSYDAVREVEDSRVLTPENHVLVLRWFEKKYRAVAPLIIDHQVKRVFGERTRIVTTLDSRSPQVVGQRLYAEIRKTQLCIADWTAWRPNVLFEFGVRLAVNPIDPILVLSDLAPDGWEADEWPRSEPDDKSRELLSSFFAPIPFEMATDPQSEAGEPDNPVFIALEEFDPQRGRRVQGAKLSPGRTYNVVCEAVDRAREPGGRPVERFLEAHAELLAGPAVPETGGLPILYSEALGQQAREASADYLLAAWYYLDGRHKVLSRLASRQLMPDDPYVALLLDIGAKLLDRLRNVRGRDYGQVTAEVRRDVATLTAIVKP